MVTTVLLWILAAALVAVGLAGTVMPALPGVPLLFLGLLTAAWAEDFAYVSTGTLLALAAMAALAYLADFVAGALGARRYGASRRAAVGAAIGALVGIFFGLPGLLLGPFAGALIGELSKRSSLAAASRAGWGATVGLVLGTAAKMALAFAMLGLFAFARFV
jgi:uncharacterized protein YqgC (DUF456 family)